MLSLLVFIPPGKHLKNYHDWRWRGDNVAAVLPPSELRFDDLQVKRCLIYTLIKK